MQGIPPWPTSKDDCVNRIGENPICDHLDGFTKIKENMEHLGRLATVYRDLLNQQAARYDALAAEMTTASEQLTAAERTVATLQEQLEEARAQGERVSRSDQDALRQAREREANCRAMLGEVARKFDEEERQFVEQTEQLNRDLLEAQAMVAGQRPGAGQRRPGSGEAPPATKVRRQDIADQSPAEAASVLADVMARHSDEGVYERMKLQLRNAWSRETQFERTEEAKDIIERFARETEPDFEGQEFAAYLLRAADISLALRDPINETYTDKFANALATRDSRIARFLGIY